MSHIQSQMQHSVADKIQLKDILQLMDVLPDVKINRHSKEHHIFSKYFKNIDQNVLKELINNQPEKGKDIALSTKYRLEGNIHYEEENFAVAMSLYTTSLTLAPRDTTEYALTIANRSAVLFALKMYKECLVDTARVFKSDYPKHMLYKMYMRQARCYLKLKCYGKASKAVQNAKTSFETAKVSLKKELSELAVKEIKDLEKCLKNHSDTDETVDEKEEESLPELTGGENPYFAFASNAVAMRRDKPRGRHVVAIRDIKKGGVLFVEEPYSTSVQLFRKTYFTYCSECFTSSLTCIPCTYCCMVIFCSDECRHLHWYSRHRWECAAVRRSAVAQELTLALGILFRVSHTGFSTTIRNTSIYGNKINNYPFVNQLMTHKFTIPLETYTGYVKAAAWLVVYLEHFTDYFDWLHGRYDKLRGSREELHVMVGGLLLKFFCQNDTNSEDINNTIVSREDKYNIGFKSNPLACALYVSSSAVNHACLPNAVQSFHGSTKVVRAISDINKDIEITVCYLEKSDMHMPDQRRKALHEKYYFTCTCCVCTDGHSLFPWLCKKCRGPAFPTADEQIAECTDCKQTFQLDRHMKLKEKAELRIGNYGKTRDLHKIQQAFTIMRRIYHESNFTLALVYSNFVVECEFIDDIESSLKYLEILVELHQAIYQPASKENVNLLLKYCLTLVHYCLLVKYKDPDLYKRYLNETKEVIANTTELLKYHMCEKRAVNYQQNMLRMLDVGDNVDKALQLYHYNILDS